MRRSDQRRAAVIALYQHDLTGRELSQTLDRNASLFSRSLAHAAADMALELDEIIDRHAHGWSVDRIQPLERSIMRVALIEMLHPDVAPSDYRGGRRERQDLLRCRCAGLRKRRAGRGPARGQGECEHRMSSVEHLDDLISRLERAAEQLRSGDLSPDAAAGMVEDCAALAAQAAAELEQLTRAEASARAPGQDSLL